MNGYDINTLNEEQKAALFKTEGVVLVTAGAGSGKTRLLTHRICFLIEKGVPHYQILAITFTNKATNEMKSRIAAMCDQNVWISTFHSMCVRMLRENIDHLEGYDKNFSIIAEADKTKILKDLLKQNLGEDDDLDKVSSHLDNLKNKGLGVVEYFDAIREFDNSKAVRFYEKICLGYEEFLAKNNALDFDDLLNKTLFLFQNFPSVLNRYAERFKYIMVDEFQDTNLVQYKLVKLLASVHKNLFVVGDEDQCIYSWRGANFKNIFSLQKDFDDVHTFKLERNYRSTKNILTLANNVIANNSERLDKNLWTDKEEGAAPVVYEAYDELDEARSVASMIEDLVQEGYSYSDFAVLMRINAMSRPFEDALLRKNISYKLYGGFKFYERAEIKIVLAYLSAFVNPKDEISLGKIINFPKRGIGDVALTNLKIEAGEVGLLDYLLSEKFAFSKYFKKLESFVSVFKNLLEEKNSLTLAEFVTRVIGDFGIAVAVAGSDEEAINKLGNLDSLILSVSEYMEESQEATLEDYLANVMLRSESDNIQEDGFVSLSTVHAVKGLEFKVVFVVGCEEGIFPLARSSNSHSEMEEERRLMYVAITRAEERLVLSYATKRFMYGKSSYQTASKFLKELGIVSKRAEFVLPKTQSAEPAKKQSETYQSDFAVGDRVFHNRFGEGEISSLSDDGFVADINFDDFGIKSLMLNLAKLEKLN